MVKKINKEQFIIEGIPSIKFTKEEGCLIDISKPSQELIVKQKEFIQKGGIKFKEKRKKDRK